MALTLDATVGGSTSNAYLSVARSNVLAESLPHLNDWLIDPSINKPQLLIHATRLIDRHFVPMGRKANSSQALWWPQAGIYYDCTVISISPGVIPEFVEMACLEWGWSLHENPDSESDAFIGLTSLDTPSFNMEFTGSETPVVPKVVSMLLSPYTMRKPKPFVMLIRT